MCIARPSKINGKIYPVFLRFCSHSVVNCGIDEKNFFVFGSGNVLSPTRTTIQLMFTLICTGISRTLLRLL